ncbi:hypothetical protein AAFF_G00356600 [Aldrovandia affinis]|uniref:Uncharacterized protein n=1 Tax=Aldrovandia affinis TaxID=143900 RepID=A0AAD7T8R3_9TELE|nr:hypothetical protein AAFF_G00356600 [Aldrovandia affinis]
MRTLALSANEPERAPSLAAPVRIKVTLACIRHIPPPIIVIAIIIIIIIIIKDFWPVSYVPFLYLSSPSPAFCRCAGLGTHIYSGSALGTGGKGASVTGNRGQCHSHPALGSRAHAKPVITVPKLPPDSPPPRSLQHRSHGNTPHSSAAELGIPKVIPTISHQAQAVPYKACPASDFCSPSTAA